MVSEGAGFRRDVSLSLKNVSIVTKKDDKKAQEYAKTLAKWLGEKQILSQMEVITPELDLIIVLGGDGTLLHIAENGGSPCYSCTWN